MTRNPTLQLALLGSLFASKAAFAQPEPPGEPAPTAESAPMSQPAPDALPEPESDLTVSSAPTASSTAEVQEVHSNSEIDDVWMLAVAPRFGLIVPTSKLSPFVSVGLELGYRLPTLDRRVSLIADIAYTRPSRNASANDDRVGGDTIFDTKESELKLGLGGSFRLLTKIATLVPWVGASAVVQMLTSSQTNDLSPGENTARSTKFGGEVFAGADYRLGPGYALGEARFVLTDLDDLITGNSNAGSVNLSIGYRFVF